MLTGIAAISTPHDDDIYAGSKLRFRRQALGLSQTAVADALGITFQQIQKYERGANRISASRLQALASLMGVPVSFFFKSGDDMPSEQAAVSAEAYGHLTFLTEREGFQLNQSFAAIRNETVRKAILDMVVAIAKQSSPSAAATGETEE